MDPSIISQADSVASTNWPSISDEAINDVYEEWSNETIPPHIFDGGTFAPGYLESFTLPPHVDAADLPWFLQEGKLAPEFREGDTLPPWLMGNDTLAPGLWQDGELNTDFIMDWTSDLVPALSSFSLESEVPVEPVFQPFPVVEYERVSVCLFLFWCWHHDTV